MQRMDRTMILSAQSAVVPALLTGPLPTAHCRLTRRRMRGNARVIEHLNEALREELTAINQYFLHAEMCHNWGYHGLGDYIKKQSIDEMKHAEELIERILFLDATPSMDYLPLNVGGNVKEQLEAD